MTSCQLSAPPILVLTWIDSENVGGCILSVCPSQRLSSSLADSAARVSEVKAAGCTHLSHAVVL